jgi:P pilus assembly protein, chaperone PapD
MFLLRHIPTAAFITATLSIPAIASVQLGSTRVIYHSDDKNVSVQVNNPGKEPVLLQSWIDDGDTQLSPEKINVPFVLTPPLTRVNQGEGQTLRLAYIGTNLPVNRESIYWLNVLEIPPVAGKNSNNIQVAFRSRIKIFYRPAPLTDKGAQEAPAQLKWNVQGDRITIANPTPYYVSILEIAATVNGKEFSIPADMVAPHSKESFVVPTTIKLNSGTKISVNTMNDYGAVVTQDIQQ